MVERWSSRWGFLLAAIGAAVGLGNIWRFSAVVGQNGGGAYLVPYLVAAIVLAFPLLILEISVGRDRRADVVTAFKSVRREFEGLGWIVAGSVILLLSYYVVLTGWVLAFLVGSASGPGLRFAPFTASYWPVVAFVVATVVTGAVVSAGVRGGIERMATFAIPVIFAVLLLLVAYATTLSGFDAAVSFLFTPDFSVLGDPILWSVAFGQVFFSLSVGQGIMLTYGSYLDEDTDVVRSAAWIVAADIAVALLAGLAIFPVVFTVGLEPSLGTELAFTTLPEAFGRMPFGRFVAVAFFGLLFLAALSSAVSLLEVGVSTVLRMTGRSRLQVTAILTGLVLLLGLPSALSYSAVGLRIFDVRVLDWMDETVGTLALPVTAFLIAVVFTWFQDRERVRAQIGDSLLVPLLRYAIPTALFVVTAVRFAARVDGSFWQYLPGITVLGTPLRVGVTVGVLAIVYLLGRYVLRYRHGRQSSRFR